MDLMGLLFKFALESFHILAWPLVAIAYPLCASIQAIENNSNTKKLITYWICFSLILLFENAFQQLLHSFPYWPYMKLMIVGCLVTPQFDGSFYIYNHFVHPYLSMNPHFVFNWLIKLSDILKQDYPLTQAKRESKETERQALQNLVRQTESDLALQGIARYAQIAAGKDLPDLIASKTLQKEWTCARSEAELSDSKSSQQLWTCVLCKVKCTGKLDLISHLQGQRHAKALESLKSIPNSKYYFKPWTCGICQKTLKNQNDLILHLQSKRHLAACEHQKVEEMSGKGEVSSASLEININSPECEALNLRRSRSVVEVRDCKWWWCTICNVSCTSEQTMNCHLNGRCYGTD